MTVCVYYGGSCRGIQKFAHTAASAQPAMRAAKGLQRCVWPNSSWPERAPHIVPAPRITQAPEACSPGVGAGGGGAPGLPARCWPCVAQLAVFVCTSALHTYAAAYWAGSAPRLAEESRAGGEPAAMLRRCPNCSIVFRSAAVPGPQGAGAVRRPGLHLPSGIIAGRGQRGSSGLHAFEPLLPSNISTPRCPGSAGVASCEACISAF